MIDALIEKCAVEGSPPAIIRQIVTAESADNSLAIGVDKKLAPDFRQPTTVESAAEVSRLLVAEGLSIDLGLMQINSSNWDRYELSIEKVLDPCINIAVGSRIFMRGYRAAVMFYGETELATKTALSAYNTGTLHKGFQNGYLNRYYDETTGKSKKTTPQSSNSEVDIDFGASDMQNLEVSGF